jgi:hypothetical protein
MPTYTDYIDALKNPKLTLCDPSLKDGEAVRGDKRRNLWIDVGQFALTARFTAHQQEWAIRCFSNALDSNFEERYRHVSHFINQHKQNIDFLVDIEFQAEGILVDGNWYPICKMNWVQGEKLSKYIESQKKTSHKLSFLSEAFLNVILVLETMRIAHGDLQHGNIMIEGRKLFLVDYDCMYLPSYDGLKLISSEIGHMNYQHPSRNETHFNSDLDRFSAISIYLSLKALEKDHSLYPDGGESLFFKSDDYKNPDQSTNIQKLAQIGYASAAESFKKICLGDIRDIPSLREFIRQDQTLLEELGASSREKVKSEPIILSFEQLKWEPKPFKVISNKAKSLPPPPAQSKPSTPSAPLPKFASLNSIQPITSTAPVPQKVASSSTFAPLTQLPNPSVQTSNPSPSVFTSTPPHSASISPTHTTPSYISPIFLTRFLFATVAVVMMVVLQSLIRMGNNVIDVSFFTDIGFIIISNYVHISLMSLALTIKYSILEKGINKGFLKRLMFGVLSLPFLILFLYLWDVFIYGLGTLSLFSLGILAGSIILPITLFQKRPLLQQLILMGLGALFSFQELYGDYYNSDRTLYIAYFSCLSIIPWLPYNQSIQVSLGRGAQIFPRYLPLIAVFLVIVIAQVSDIQVASQSPRFQPNSFIATSTPRPPATSTPRPSATSTPRPSATHTPRPSVISTSIPPTILSVTNNDSCTNLIFTISYTISNSRGGKISMLDSSGVPVDSLNIGGGSDIINWAGWNCREASCSATFVVEDANGQVSSEYTNRISCVPPTPIATATPTPRRGTINVTTEYAIVRDSPSTNGTQQTRLRNGTAIEIVDTRNGWYQVRRAGASTPLGWVRADLIRR